MKAYAEEVNVQKGNRWSKAQSYALDISLLWFTQRFYQHRPLPHLPKCNPLKHLNILCCVVAIREKNVPG